MYSFELRSQWRFFGISKSDWIRLYASIYKDTKTIQKNGSRNSTLSIPIKKSFATSSISPSSTKLYVTTVTSH